MVVNGVRFEAPKWGKSLGLEQNGGHIRAVDTISDKELWLIEVYKIRYNGDIEDDKLDRFIVEIELASKGIIKVKSEDCGVYLLEIATQNVSEERSPPC